MSSNFEPPVFLVFQSCFLIFGLNSVLRIFILNILLGLMDLGQLIRQQAGVHVCYRVCIVEPRYSWSASLSVYYMMNIIYGEREGVFAGLLQEFMHRWPTHSPCDQRNALVSWLFLLRTCKYSSLRNREKKNGLSRQTEASFPYRLPITNVIGIVPPVYRVSKQLGMYLSNEELAI